MDLAHAGAVQAPPLQVHRVDRAIAVDYLVFHGQPSSPDGNLPRLAHSSCRRYRGGVAPTDRHPCDDGYELARCAHAVTSRARIPHPVQAAALVVAMATGMHLNDLSSIRLRDLSEDASALGGYLAGDGIDETVRMPIPGFARDLFIAARAFGWIPDQFAQAIGLARAMPSAPCASTCGEAEGASS